MPAEAARVSAVPLPHALAYLGFIAIGLLQLLLARWLAKNMRELVAKGKRAKGRFVGSKGAQSPVSGNSSTYGVVAFTTDDGREGEVQSKIGLAWGRKRGAEVTVIYDPDDLENATLETWTEMWMAPTLAAFNGGLMALAAIVVGALQLLGVITPG